MRALLMSFALLSSSACERGLTEVRPPESVPEFLGEYSGVFRGIGIRKDDVGRTVVLHLRDKIVVSPFQFDDAGIPHLSRFASVGLIPADITEPVRAASVVILDANEAGMWPSDATCNPSENDHWAAVPLAQLQSQVGQRVGECNASPSTCHTVCYMPNRFDRGTGALGNCLEGGAACSYPVTLYGRVGRDVLQLLFEENTLAPAPEFERLECTEPDNDGWQRCTPELPGCEGYGRCKFLDKQCDFDSRIAGVYQAELRREGSSETRVVELAVAIANNVPAVVVFLSDEVLGDRLMIGAFDPMTREFRANDGETPVDPAWTIRDGQEPHIEISGKVVEDPTAGVVRFADGFWTESRNGERTVFTLTASRLSGVTPGAVCQADHCQATPQFCPLGNAAIRGSTLQLSSDLNDGGCVVTECQRVLEQSSLCEPLPSCDGSPFVNLDVWLSPPACPADDPGCDEDERESCVRFVCHDEAYGPATPANWYQVDLGCPGAMILADQGQAGMKIECGGPECPNQPAECPLGESPLVATQLMPLSTSSTGCMSYRCTQTFDVSDVCSDAPTSCSPGDTLVPTSIRSGASPCVEYTCVPGYGSMCAGCLTGCPDHDPTVCTDGVSVRGDGCAGPWVFCESNPQCEPRPVDCYVDLEGLLERYTPDLDPWDCMQWSCEQYYTSNGLCDLDPPSALGCTGGDVPTLEWVSLSNCFDYVCAPSCTGSCGTCTPCEDPAFPDTCDLPDHYWVGQGCGDCLTVSCHQQ